MLKNKCCLYVIISIRFFSITICNLLIEFPSYIQAIPKVNLRILNDPNLYHRSLSEIKRSIAMLPSQELYRTIVYILFTHQQKQFLLNLEKFKYTWKYI